ncbi:hypothetical protein QUF64_07205, partial [Anaerolineales bacterium HSG6]|nr:hypothetical protein [Anaerolineales bacterium HSG6]
PPSTRHITANGGGIYNNSGSVDMTNTLVSSNTASSNGGGIFSQGIDSVVTLINSTVSSNMARAGGGDLKF